MLRPSFESPRSRPMNSPSFAFLASRTGLRDRPQRLKVPTLSEGICSFFLLITLLIFALSASAQGPATGTPPFGSFGGGPDVINLANLNSHITIPVVHKPGRGTNFSYDLSYDSSTWYPAAGTWQPVANWGWRGQTEIAFGYVSYKSNFHRCPILGDGNYVIYDTYVYHDLLGIAHAYTSSAEIDCNGIFTGFAETAADGSGFTLTATDVGAATITSS